MDTQQINRTLLALTPDARPCVFLFTPDNGRSEPVFVVDRSRISPSVKLRLIRSGARRFVSGTITKGSDGKLSFQSPKLSPKKLRILVKLLADQVPILEGARIRTD